jgi:ubiquinol-cytochrome c reductase iron-sulfur subunit
VYNIFAKVNNCAETAQLAFTSGRKRNPPLHSPSEMAACRRPAPYWPPWLKNGENLVSHAEDHEGTRRDFLYYATAGAGAVATGAAVWPLVNQMNPSADVRALSSIRVDVSGVEVGSQLTVKWLGKPVFIRRRTEEEIAAARAVSLDDLTIDKGAQNANKPGADALDQNRTLDEAGEWLVMIGVCTHLGCVPIGNGSGEFGGWFCPCHGSHYDAAGRIRKGPAPRNLDVPVAEFVDETTIKLG